MEYLTLSECASKFIGSRRYCPTAKDRNTVRNLLDKLLYQPSLLNAVDKVRFDPDDYHDAVINTVCEYSNNKDNAIRILKEYSSFVTQKSETDVSEIQWPPIPVSSSFERQMFISKYLQDPDHMIDDLQDLLWVSSRTIEDDLKKLRGNDDDPIQICGREFVIEDTKRSDGKLAFKSTVHPFFLTLNLTQVMVILEGLREKANDPSLKGYAMSAACDIWEQLSEYGKNRLFFVLKNLMPSDLAWYDKLNQMQHENRPRFSSERLCSKTEGVNSMLECLKNGLPVFIEYSQGDNVEFIEDAYVLRLLEHGRFLINHNGTERVLQSDKILRSAAKKELLL